uniref:LsmAD domain-containing protein n=1 Tax=Chromera velia CCMP2878 TaxID=1169474 RepID=A0A0K6S6D5_9ALVE|eukprot:Cvel_15719.t2-p1 / transcript=Cvel_15719.t2 / gene=Cvel_15719 / organism=Chromera_velia_CCMP2878 / gene_product=hypothetical protein / transcript_product=hypothetical protein / location=Cvel_scaffold1175:9333-20757(-) / protein_length=1530 / sequence_SO=supercontig / SO=protein_coding / is_pseudo=false
MRNDGEKQARVPANRGKDVNPERFMYVMCSLVGQTVVCSMKNGAQIEGLFWSCTPGFEAGRSSSSNPEMSISLKLARELADEETGRRTGEVVENMIVWHKDLVALSAKNVPVDVMAHEDAKKKLKNEAFRTDTEISSTLGPLGGERDLVKFTDWGGSGGGLEDGGGLGGLESLESKRGGLAQRGGGRGGGAANAHVFDQFTVNQDKFKVSSTYHEELYTTALNREAIPDEYKRRAERIAREIEDSGGNYDAENLEGKDDQDEERLFGAVDGTGGYKKDNLKGEAGGRGGGNFKQQGGGGTGTGDSPRGQGDKGKKGGPAKPPPHPSAGMGLDSSGRPLVGGPDMLSVSAGLEMMDDGRRTKGQTGGRSDGKTGVLPLMPGEKKDERPSRAGPGMTGLNALCLEPALPKLDDHMRNQWINFKMTQTGKKQTRSDQSDRKNEKEEFKQSLERISQLLSSGTVTPKKASKAADSPGAPPLLKDQQKVGAAAGAQGAAAAASSHAGPGGPAGPRPLGLPAQQQQLQQQVGVAGNGGPLGGMHLPRQPGVQRDKQDKDGLKQGGAMNPNAFSFNPNANAFTPTGIQGGQGGNGGSQASQSQTSGQGGGAGAAAAADPAVRLAMQAAAHLQGGANGAGAPTGGKSGETRGPDLTTANLQAAAMQLEQEQQKQQQQQRQQDRNRVGGAQGGDGRTAGQGQAGGAPAGGEEKRPIQPLVEKAELVQKNISSVLDEGLAKLKKPVGNVQSVGGKGNKAANGKDGKAGGQRDDGDPDAPWKWPTAVGVEYSKTFGVAPPHVQQANFPAHGGVGSLPFQIQQAQAAMAAGLPVGQQLAGQLGGHLYSPYAPILAGGQAGMVTPLQIQQLFGALQLQQQQQQQAPQSIPHSPPQASPNVPGVQQQQQQQGSSAPEGHQGQQQQQQGQPSAQGQAGPNQGQQQTDTPLHPQQNFPPNHQHQVYNPMLLQPTFQHLQQQIQQAQAYGQAYPQLAAAALQVPTTQPITLAQLQHLVIQPNLTPQQQLLQFHAIQAAAQGLAQGQMNLPGQESDGQGDQAGPGGPQAHGGIDPAHIHAAILAQAQQQGGTEGGGQPPLYLTPGAAPFLQLQNPQTPNPAAASGISPELLSQAQMMLGQMQHQQQQQGAAQVAGVQGQGQQAGGAQTQHGEGEGGGQGQGENERGRNAGNRPQGAGGPATSQQQSPAQQQPGGPRGSIPLPQQQQQQQPGGAGPEGGGAFPATLQLANLIGNQPGPEDGGHPGGPQGQGGLPQQPPNQQQQRMPQQHQPFNLQGQPQTHAALLAAQQGGGGLPQALQQHLQGQPPLTPQQQQQLHNLGLFQGNPQTNLAVLQSLGGHFAGQGGPLPHQQGHQGGPQGGQQQQFFLQGGQQGGVGLQGDPKGMLQQQQQQQFMGGHGFVSRNQMPLQPGHHPPGRPGGGGPGQQQQQPGGPGGGLLPMQHQGLLMGGGGMYGGDMGGDDAGLHGHEGMRGVPGPGPGPHGGMPHGGDVDHQRGLMGGGGGGGRGYGGGGHRHMALPPPSNPGMSPSPE